MIIYPAIDIMSGKVVRLRQGRFDEETVFPGEPYEIAKMYEKKGATHIHVVDLDGARSGSSVNDDAIRRITEAVNAKVQVGGGIRNMQAIEEKFALGVSKVVLGTAAIKNPDFVKEAVRTYGDRISVGIDAVNSLVAISGWEEVSEVSALKLCFDMRELGVGSIIYTDITKDGMMNGPNLHATKELIDKTGMKIIASGGVTGLKDLENLKMIKAHGVIIGKAFLTGEFSLEDAIFFER